MNMTEKKDRVEGSAAVRTRLGAYEWFQAIPFAAVHISVFFAFLTGVSARDLTICAILFLVRIWAVTAGYHRYFSHRTYKTSRFFQFILAFLAQSSAQKGVLWWAAHHRHHHRHSDQPADVHSPLQRGILYAHIGWLFDNTTDTDFSKVRDLARYPELKWLNRYFLVPPILLAVAVTVSFGWSALVVGFLWSTVLTWHVTFMINSLAHVFGSRRYETTDTSRNGLILALLTLGEGWHNNHHFYPAAARQGFFWWEVDITYYVLRLLALVRIVWDIKEPSKRVFLATREQSPAISK